MLGFSRDGASREREAAAPEEAAEGVALPCMFRVELGAEGSSLPEVCVCVPPPPPAHHLLAAFGGSMAAHTDPTRGAAVHCASSAVLTHEAVHGHTPTSHPNPVQCRRCDHGATRRLYKPIKGPPVGLLGCPGVVKLAFPTEDSKLVHACQS